MPIRPILSLPIPWLPIWNVFLRPSIIRFLPMEEGDFFRLPYVSPGGEGFNTTLQVNRWHVLCTLNGVRCGDKICAPLSSIVAGGVVLFEIVCQIVLSRHPTHHILSLSWWATCASRRLSDSLKKWLQVLLPLRYLGRFKMFMHSAWTCPLNGSFLGGALLVSADAIMMEWYPPVLLFAPVSDIKEALLWICRIIPLAWYLVMDIYCVTA